MVSTLENHAEHKTYCEADDAGNKRVHSLSPFLVADDGLEPSAPLL